MYIYKQPSQQWKPTIPLICLLLLSTIFLTATAAAVLCFISVYNTSKNGDSVLSINTRSNEKLSQSQTNAFYKYLMREKNSKERQRRQASSADDQVTKNISLIKPYWANLSPYADNAPDVFGVQDTGLPDGCQVEQAFVLHRHAARFPGAADTLVIDPVIAKLKNTTGQYTGPLSFFNSWVNKLGSDLLLPQGASMEYQSGVDFFDRYGRILYDTQKGQNYYNETDQIKPKLRTNTVQRVYDSVHAWADGFFTLYNQKDKYDLTVIPAAPDANNTLASFFSCSNFFDPSFGILNMETDIYKPIEYFTETMITRLRQYVPEDIELNAEDVFIMQTLCPYEYVALGSSDFCSLFTLNEWKSFRYTYDLFTYYGFSYGSPLGRTIGIGVAQELLARLTNQYITISNSSVNSTLDGNPDTFPLGQKFYLDMTHDFIIVAMLTAMNIDYFKEDLSRDQFNPTPEDRHFKGNIVIPYAARLITEKIGCTCTNPIAANTPRTQYTPTQYGYSADNATNKFIRMRLNNGIVPLSSIRGGYCNGRTDGLCSLNNFIASQANLSVLANYQQLCFTRFTYNESEFNYDGNYFP